MRVLVHKSKVLTWSPRKPAPRPCRRVPAGSAALGGRSGRRLASSSSCLICWPWREVPRGQAGPPGPHPAWSPQGSYKELLYVFFMVKDAGLTPDLLSYAAALQCMGRLDQSTTTIQRWVGTRADPRRRGEASSLALPGARPPPPAATWHWVPRRCLDQMGQDGLKLQELFTSVPLCQEERALVLRAVRKVQPTFRPPPPPQCPPQVNTSPLLREIYATVSRPSGVSGGLGPSPSSSRSPPPPGGALPTP